MTQDLLQTALSVPDVLERGGRRPCLLVVDDQPVNIQALYRIFSPDHRVLMATSGARVLSLCKEDPPDLVLLDVVMPDMDGHAVCALLKADEQTRNIPVIFVTAHNDSAEETLGLELGAVDFIAKPVNPAVVRARVRTHITLKYQSDLLRQMVFVDGLTGVSNRRRFDEQLQAHWTLASRSQAPLGLLLLDVDHFKLYNDRYGHQAGDDCLRRVAKAIQQTLLRSIDLVARYGGEEFACILPATDLPGALDVANRIEKQVRRLDIPHGGSQVDGVLTVSIGCAVGSPDRHNTPEELLALADAQLYGAKRSGRARACGATLGAANARAPDSTSPQSAVPQAAPVLALAA